MKTIPRKVYATLITSVLVTLFLIQPHAGFMLYLVALPLLVWFLYNLQFVFTPSEARKWLLLRMAVWLMSIILVVVVHYHYHQAARQVANDIVTQIEKYRSKTGEYPRTLDEIGVTKEKLRTQLGLSRYSYKEGKTLYFFYAVTFIPFDTYQYDFVSKQWRYRS